MFTEQQIVFSIRPAESGIWIEEVCRKMGISVATFYHPARKTRFLQVRDIKS